MNKNAIALVAAAAVGVAGAVMVLKEKPTCYQASIGSTCGRPLSDGGFVAYGPAAILIGGQVKGSCEVVKCPPEM